MSYCRFSDADVYVYLDVGGYLNCCACSLGKLEDGDLFPESFYATATDDMLAHLQLHRDAGHDVPDYAIERLREEREENDAWMAKQATSPRKELS